MTDKQFEFDVALSFADEYREFVKHVKEILTGNTMFS